VASVPKLPIKTISSMLCHNHMCFLYKSIVLNKLPLSPVEAQKSVDKQGNLNQLTQRVSNLENATRL
jgi:hypothetical protein